jgi:aliphatic nitrilase
VCEPKQFHDVVGSYNRFDVFRLSVGRSRRPPALFDDGEGAPEAEPRPPGEP